MAVLISVYHRDDPALFRKAVLSIVNQHLVEANSIRLYLGVDGPLPHALDTEIAALQQHLYRVVRFARNRGLAPVLNDLIAMLDHEQLIFRMDADDEAHPDRFISQLRFMAHNPDTAILGTAMIERHVDGSERLVSFPLTHEEARRNLCWRTPIAHPTACIRREVFAQLGGYPTNAHNEDIALWFEAAIRGFRFANLREPLLYFNVSESFWKRRGLAKAWGEFKCYVSGWYRLEGLNWRLVLPSVRLAFRLSPVALRRIGYACRVRNREIRQKQIR